MHPILHHKYRLAAYLGSWLLFSLFLSVLVKWMTGMDWLVSAVLILPPGLIHAFFGLSVFYLCRVFPIEKTHYKKVLTAFFSAGLLSNLIWCGIAFLWYGIVITSINVPFDESFAQVYFTVLFLVGLLLYWLSAVIHYLIIEFERSASMEKRAFELTLLAKENELKMLRSQVDPHFLFNSLNSLNALIKSDPESARNMAYALADFFRKTLSTGQKPFIPIRDEMELIGYFLNIEKVRFGERLQCDIHVQDPCYDQLIPVFLLQPLIENAVKHGISNLIEGGVIAIHIKTEPHRLRIEIRNPYDVSTTGKTGTQTGLANVKNRLEQIYHGQAHFCVNPSEGIFRVQITIPVNG